MRLQHSCSFAGVEFSLLAVGDFLSSVRPCKHIPACFIVSHRFVSSHQLMLLFLREDIMYVVIIVCVGSIHPYPKLPFYSVPHPTLKFVSHLRVHPLQFKRWSGQLRQIWLDMNASSLAVSPVTACGNQQQTTACDSHCRFTARENSRRSSRALADDKQETGILMSPCRCVGSWGSTSSVFGWSTLCSAGEGSILPKASYANFANGSVCGYM